MTSPATITVEQAGALLGISRRSAYRAAASGHIPTIRLGRRPSSWPTGHALPHARDHNETGPCFGQLPQPRGAE
ncbi:MAG: helix-turn-helix domain-containing protein [Actinomycetota bacterium]|nr:helix-turn-helix domain-containing protein [Actinomycetota bacterium]